ncbi:GUP1 [[Candida] subhashii]|uniref:GUP1 n=1 Tax=[Candida] subhashii TaxID=561895 RepID=A0A8J5UVN3_9ASCO|nr:GUP1 [[Candida] subhashii]KAG7661144.1 GUP1 [[Candida] subhashii]
MTSVTTLFTQIQNFFSLETLDTRLSPSSNSQQKRQSIIKKANPESRWKTLEFRIYIVIVILAVPSMFKAAMEASNETNPNYPRFQHLLSDGWIWGRKVDNSDQQYRFFRNNLPLLAVLVIIHVGIRRLINGIASTKKRTYFDFGFGILFLIGAHGVNVLKICVHLTVNYCISRFIPDKKVAVWSTWIYGVSTLFINHWWGSYPFGMEILDLGFKGIIARWDVFYNFTLLRMLSFNLDYLERKTTINNLQPQQLETKEATSSSLVNLEDRQRLTAPLPIEDYNPINYIAYITYIPLFLAGPIITFNDYIYQSNYDQLKSVQNYYRIFQYFIRFCFCVLVMEILLHFTYVVAVSKTKAWDNDTPFQLSMLGMFNLNIIWLKLLIPWRMFRLWALLDGIDPPENMIRCMDNNFSALAFWRAWHRSYNRWVIRYIYIPLGGGGKYRILNSLLVFSFVAIWHDIELRLLMWGWLIVVFLTPEIIATSYFKRFSEAWWYRYLCGLGAVVNIWMMMIANLVGFCLGKDGTLKLLHDLFKTWDGFRFFLLSCSALFVASQVMFELREGEKRKGIDVRC